MISENCLSWRKMLTSAVSKLSNRH